MDKQVLEFLPLILLGGIVIYIRTALIVNNDNRSLYELLALYIILAIYGVSENVYITVAVLIMIIIADFILFRKQKRDKKKLYLMLVVLLS